MRIDEVISVLREKLQPEDEAVNGDKTILYMPGGHEVQIFIDGDAVQVDVMLFAGGVSVDPDEDPEGIVESVEDHLNRRDF